jgi:hypothetical protein
MKKAKTLIACAGVAALLPLGAWASANATTLGGPTGTGFYGTVDPILEWYGSGTLPADEARGAASAGATTYDLNRDGVISADEQREAERRAEPRRESFSGPSWATNPPAPAQ